MSCFSVWDIQGCGCSCSVAVTGTINLCSGLTKSGTTVEAHDSTAGGTLLASTTTNSSGDFTLSGIPATAGNNLVIVANRTNFATATRTLTYSTSVFDDAHWMCGATTTIGVGLIQPAPDSTHHCHIDCAEPLPDTITMGDTVLGSRTLTWNGLLWQNITQGLGDCGHCTGLTPSTLTMRWRLSPNGFFDVYWTCDHDYPNLFSVIFNGRTTTSSCPPSYSASVTIPTNGGAYCAASPPSFTFSA